MVQTEIFDTWEDGTKLIKTYSDQGMMIEQVDTGIRYAEAIDPDFMNREYIETDEIIPEEPEEEVEENGEQYSSHECNGSW